MDADLPLIARGLEPRPGAVARHPAPLPGRPRLPAHPHQAGHHRRRAAFIEAHRNELPELETIDEERRLYPRDGFAAHLIGYVGEVSEEDLNNPRYAAYEPGDVVGKAGVEETYDELLRGPGRLPRCDCG